MTEPDDSPRTEAGRRLRHSDWQYMTADEINDAILAIESEAAAGPRDEGLDEETLARALRIAYEDDHPRGDNWTEDARVIAAEYARLRDAARE